LPVGTAWGERIGFGKDPAECLLCPPKDYHKLSRLHILPSSGRAVEQDDWPGYTDAENASIGPNVKLPLFARVDFETVTIVIQLDIVLVRWLAARGVLVRYTEDRNNLESLVNKILWQGP
jgi:hypothetical protein